MIIAPAGGLDPGRRDCPYGRHRRARPGRAEGVRLVRRRQPGVAHAGHDPGQSAPARQRARPRRCPPPTPPSGVDRSGFDFAKFVAHIFPESMIGAMAEQRHPADRRLLAVPRRRDHRGRRARQAAGSRARGAGQGDAGRHRLCHALRADRGVRRGHRDDRRARHLDPRHLRLFHGQLLLSAWSSCGRC